MPKPSTATARPKKNIGAWFRTHRAEAAGGGLVAVAGIAYLRHRKGGGSSGISQSTGVPVAGTIPVGNTSDGTGGSFTGGGGGTDPGSDNQGILAGLAALITGQQTLADTFQGSSDQQTAADASIISDLGNISDQLSSTGQAPGATPAGGAHPIPKKTVKPLARPKPTKKAAHANPRPPAKPGKAKTPMPVAGHPGTPTMRAPVKAPGAKPAKPAPKPPAKPKAEYGPIGNKPGRAPVRTPPVVKPKAAPKKPPPTKVKYV